MKTFWVKIIWREGTRWHHVAIQARGKEELNRILWREFGSHTITELEVF